MGLFKRYKDKILIILIIFNLITIAIVMMKNSGRGNGSGMNSGIISKAYSDIFKDKLARRTPVVDIAEKVSPVVVCIGAVKTSYVTALRPDFFDFFSPFMSPYQLYQYKERLPFLGSGFIIDSKGYVLTNYHVVEDSSDVFITLVDGRELPGKILDADRIVDVALIKVDAKDLSVAALGDSDDCMIGETVIAIGNPFGNLIEDSHPTVTAGVISALHRNFNEDPNSGRVYQDMIQTDAAINPGNSGGPLVNLNGEVIGINSFIMSRTGGSHGIGFAIPINRAKSVVKEIITYGKIRPLWLDFEFANLTRDIARLLDASSLDGALVTNIRRNGPAYTAGLNPGDIIIKANERIIRNRDDLKNYIITKQVGDKITFEVLRNNKKTTVEYTLQEFKG